MDLLLDPSTGDLDLTRGLRFTTKPQEQRQRVELGISLNLGEFFTHINYGLPWIRNQEESLGTNLRYFLGDSFPDPENYLANELDVYIKKFPFVKTLSSNFSFNRFTREFSYSFSITTTDEEDITFPPYTTNL